MKSFLQSFLTSLLDEIIKAVIFIPLTHEVEFKLLSKEFICF